MEFRWCLWILGIGLKWKSRDAFFCQLVLIWVQFFGLGVLSELMNVDVELTGLTAREAGGLVVLLDFKMQASRRQGMAGPLWGSAQYVSEHSYTRETVNAGMCVSSTCRYPRVQTKILLNIKKLFAECAVLHMFRSITWS